MSVNVSFPQIMGILNITPDSFYDGGRYQTLDTALQHAQCLIAQGADILDIGGESTRPGAPAVTVQQECDRVIPVIEQIRREFDIPISIDSRNAPVIQAALAAGANMVNSITALGDLPSLALVAKHQVPVCLMHMQGLPQTMQQNPTYIDVLKEIKDFFIQRINACEKAGILRKNIWVDPGFGFGKTLSHNLTLLENLSFFKSLGCPILIGLSRKSMFGQILDKPVEERLYGTLAATTMALLQGASIIRSHDVAATKDVLKVVQAMRSNENADITRSNH